MIAAIGISTLVKNHVDMGKPRNLVIASVVLVCGIGGVNISLWGMTLGGIGLAGIVGILLNLILPSEDR
jgi:uracil permease